MKVLSTLLLTTFTSLALCQNKSYLPFIRFHSEFEKESWTKEDIDYIDLYASIDSTINELEVIAFKKTLADFYVNNPYSSKSGKRRVKDLELLYLSIHNTFLERYRGNVDFSELIRNKEYNCVTASILYATILNHYSIPYIILNEPGHVFLVAYPDEEYIVLQTTSPNFKDFQISKKTRENAVSKMLVNKFISKRELDTLGINRVYEINWSGQKRVHEIELIGYEYFNKTIETIDETKNYPTAVQFALRTMFLVPDNKEMKLYFSEVGNYSLLNSSGLDTSSLYLQLVTLDEVVYNHINSKDVAQRIILFWFYQHYRMIFKNSDMVTASIVPDFIYDAEDEYDDYYEDEEEDYEFEEEDDSIKDIDEEDQLEKLILKDLPVFEKNINEFVKTKEWNHDLNVFLFETTVKLLLDSENPKVLQYMVRLRDIDPDNKVVLRNQSRMLFEEYESRILQSPNDYTELIVEFKKKATNIQMSTSRIISFEVDMFNKFEQKCIELYRTNKLKLANTYFDMCTSIFENIKGELSKNQRENVEYKLGFLYIFKAEKYTKSEKIRILKEGKQLLPTHKSLVATYKDNLR